MTDPEPGLDRSQKARSRFFLILRVAVAAGLLGLVAWRVDWSQFAELAVSANYLWLLAAAASATVDRLWMSGKWLYLLRRLGVSATLRQTTHHYFTGGLVGLAVQWQLGGDVARVVGLSRKTGSTGTVMASLVAEKITGAAASAVLALAGMTLLYRLVPKGMLALFATAVLVCLAALGTLLLVTSKGGRSVVDWSLDRLSSRDGWLVEKLRLAVEALQRVAQLDRSVLLNFFFLTLGEQFVPWLNVALFATAFGLSLTIGEVAMIVPIIMFFGRLPISVESLGIREGLYVMLFSLVGWTAAEAFAVALAGRVIDFAVVGTGSLLFVGLESKQASAAQPAP